MLAGNQLKKMIIIKVHMNIDMMNEIKNLVDDMFKRSLDIYDNKNQGKFNNENITPIQLANCIIDLQNHIMISKGIQIDNNYLSRKDKKKLIEHLKELHIWISDYLLDCIDYIATTIIDEDNNKYANMSKDELIEELKKYKG